MRLTHSVTMHDESTALGRKTVYAQVNLAEICARPVEIVRYNTLEPDEEGTGVTLSWEEFEKVADLVWAHRPDRAIRDAPIVGDLCGAVLDGDPENPCVLMPDHLPVHGGAWTHIDRQGRKFNDTPSVRG